MIEGISGLALSQQATDVASLAKSYGAWSGVRTNHVVSADGKFFDESGSSRGLSTPEDLELLLALRNEADLVIVDAATARNEKYRKLSRTHLAIISASGNFDSIPATESSSGVTLFSPTAASISVNSELEHVSINLEDPFAAVIEWASKASLRALLLESGPTLTKVAFQTNSVIQSAITVTPVTSPETFTSKWNPLSSQGRLVSLAESVDASFTLWSY